MSLIGSIIVLVLAISAIVYMIIDTVQYSNRHRELQARIKEVALLRGRGVLLSSDAHDRLKEIAQETDDYLKNKKLPW